MASKLLNLVALSTLAILAASFGSSPVAAVSLTSPNHNARALGAHAVIAKKRADGDRPKCKPRPGQQPPQQQPPQQQPGGGYQSPPAGQPSQTPPPSQPLPPSGGGKGLLAWGAGDRPDLCANLKVGQVASVYNWNPQPPNCPGIEPVPMLWGSKDVDYVRNNIKPGQFKNILGINEPDHADQAYISPWDAANIYRNVLMPLRSGGTRVGCPGVTNGPSGAEWMTQFVQACGGSVAGCGCDFMQVHVYATDIQYVKTYISSYFSYNLPIWVTEFACMDFANYRAASPGEIAAFAAEIGGWLKSEGRIEKFAPFMIADNLGNVNPDNRIISGSGFNNLGMSYFS